MLFVYILLLCILAALCSAIEANLWLLSHIKTKLLEDKQTRIKNVLTIWAKHSDRILLTLFTLKIFLYISIVAFILIVEHRFAAKNTVSFTVILTGSIISLIILLLCDIVPKFIVKRKPEIISVWLVVPLYYLSWFLIVPNRLLFWLINVISALLRIPVEQKDYTFSEEEIKTIIEMGEEEGTVESDERKMIHSILEFGETIVREVMSPRVDMICIEQSAALREAVELIREHHHSRVPVYKDNIDNIVGILYAKDVLDYLEHETFQKTIVKDIMHTTMFVPETKLISELLHEFRKTKTHLAIVVDEYGGTAGVVTIEDVLEEIIGEIQDEYDTDEEEMYIQHKDYYTFDAKCPFAEFKELLDIDEEFEEESEYDSLGGYVFYQLGRIPERGETFVRHNLEFEIIDADEKRVISLKVSRIQSGFEKDDIEGHTSEDKKEL